MLVRARRARLTTYFVAWIAITAAHPSCDWRTRPVDVEIATASLSGTYYPLAKQLAWLLEQGDYPSIGKAQAVLTDGSIDNIERLVKGPPTSLLRARASSSRFSTANSARTCSI